VKADLDEFFYGYSGSVAHLGQILRYLLIFGRCLLAVRSIDKYTKAPRATAATLNNPMISAVLLPRVVGVKINGA
jgi:hypothetical protein